MLAMYDLPLRFFLCKNLFFELSCYLWYKKHVTENRKWASTLRFVIWNLSKNFRFWLVWLELRESKALSSLNLSVQSIIIFRGPCIRWATEMFKIFKLSKFNNNYLRGQFLYPERGQKQTFFDPLPPHLVHVVIEWPLMQ